MKAMEKNTVRSRGGRPKKAVKRSYAITVKCTILERKVIERKAREAGFTLSEYLRIKGLDGKFVSRQKALPKEFLEYKATLHHAAANINQIARKVNATGELESTEKAALLILEQEIKQHIVTIQNSLQL